MLLSSKKLHKKAQKKAQLNPRILSFHHDESCNWDFKLSLINVFPKGRE